MKSMRYTLGLFLSLTLFWLMNSPNDSALLLFLGLCSILLVLLLSHRMQLLDSESFPMHLFRRILPFYLWLIKEMVIGSLYVLKKIVLRDKAHAKVVTLKLDFDDELSAVIFANSITLVPGTLCMKLNHETIQVHTLSPQLAEELSGGDLAARIKRLKS